MKAVIPVLLLSLSLTLTAAEVRLGDTLDQVCVTVGMPKGQLRAGDRHLLYYDRGEIELRAGTVTRVTLLSVEAQAALEARRSAEAVRVREEQELRRVRENAEGEELKARRLADRSFQAAPPAYQFAFWDSFARRYPGVPVAEQLTVARMRLAEQQEQLRVRNEQAERLADLEARVAEAEARAAEAESTAQRATYYPIYSYGRFSRRHPNFLGSTQYPSDVSLPAPLAPRNARYVRVNDRPACGSHGSNFSSEINRRDSQVHDRCTNSGSHSFGVRNRL